ncbi:thioester reductase domain-containing protein [Pseudoalteromonas rubra]|uniref:Thioester reductase (TE) domain-containing protein n=1 Tax=Pseudoalteromonas rubra TaxID=43658 RepID=A0A4Q7ELZ1_9GAMM|nr:thioester reductase domain-containing protein [Pseudoalteromonas rubra]RZM85205.1 hypothetical protein C3B51_00715 [Pseudoalteromonas rubra]
MNSDAFLSEQKSHVLMTGATGYLGSHLVAELLQLPWLRVTCLVRAQSQQAAVQRLKDSLQSFDLWDDSYAERLDAVVADLGEPRLGLAPLVYQQLLDDIDVVLHNGAAVNYVLTYAQLKNINVNGTQALLRLAQESDVAFVNVSTLRLFDARSDGQPILESDEVDEASTAYSGYSRSKWVAEKLVANAGKRGLRYFTVRPGLVCAGKTYNSPNVNDALAKLVTGCIQLGAAPSGALQVNLTSLDYVVKGLVELMLKSGTSGKTFHLVNDDATLFSRVMEAAIELGHPLELCDYDVWVARLRSNATTSDNALLPLLDYFEPELPQKSQGRVFDSQFTQSFISQHHVDSGKLDDEALQRVVLGMRQFNLFPSPV